MNKLLTIAIPTRNRDKYLLETIDSIISQNEFINVEIIVCNNSDEKNSKLLEQYVSFDNINYFENESTLSIDENMIKVASFVKTKYFLWLGDDDFIIKDGLEKILTLLINDEYDFILLNAMLVSENLDKKIGTTIKLNKDEIFTSPKDFFLRHCFHMPFGTLIVKKELYDTVIIENHRFKGTSHAYSGLVFDYLAKKYLTAHCINILVVKEELIQLRQIPKTWKNNATIVMFKEIPEWFFLLDKFYKDEVHHILENYIVSQFRIKNLIVHRIKFQLNIKEFKQNTIYASSVQKFKYFIVSMIPILNRKK